MHQVLSELKLKDWDCLAAIYTSAAAGLCRLTLHGRILEVIVQHPDKTQIGRIRKGFDFLGHRFEPGRALMICESSIRRSEVRAVRLIEKEASKEGKADEMEDKVDTYLTNWRRWATKSCLKETGIALYDDHWAGVLGMFMLMTFYPGYETSSFDILGGIKI